MTTSQSARCPWPDLMVARHSDDDRLPRAPTFVVALRARFHQGDHMCLHCMFFHARHFLFRLPVPSSSPFPPNFPSPPRPPIKTSRSSCSDDDPPYRSSYGRAGQVDMHALAPQL